MIHRWLITFAVIWTWFANPSVAQTYSSQKSSILVGNILINGLIGGVGGAINKDESQTFFKAFGKNFIVGCVGGGIRYAAKYDSYNIHFDRNRRTVTQKFSSTAWVDRLLYYTGHSIVTNASLNKPFWDTYQVNLYGANLAYSFKEKKFKPRVSISTLGTLLYFGFSGHKLDIGNSLSYGLFYFSMNENEKANIATGGSNAIVINEHYWNVEPLISHEFVHVWQFADYTPINSFFTKSFSGVREKAFIQKLDKYVVLDLPYMGLFYMLQPQPWLFKNYYEFEAEFLGTREYVDR